MQYITDFSIASMLYLSVTMYFYFKQKKAPSTRRRLYTALLIMGMFSLILDVLCAWTDSRAMDFSLTSLYILNSVFLSLVQTSGLIFLFYALVLTGVYPKLRLSGKMLISLLNTIVVVILALAPLGSKGIYYLDENQVYQRGDSYALLYITMAIYLAVGLISVVRHRHSTPRYKRYTVFAFTIIQLSAMGIQFLFPKYLLNFTATSIALTMIYHVLQSPSEHIDPLTGAFSRSALPIFLSDLIERGTQFSIFCFPVFSVGFINSTMGSAAGDKILSGMAKALKTRFPNKSVVRASGSSFLVLDVDGSCSVTELADICAGVSEVWNTGSDIHPPVRVAVLNSEPEDSADTLMAAADFINKEYRRMATDQPMIADAEARRRLTYQKDVEEALELALDEDRLEVYYQPIHRSSGELAAIEALCRLKDERMGFISPEHFIRVAELNGSIYRLGETVLHKVCAFIEEKGVADWGLDHVGVNLSAAQCMLDELPERISGIVSGYDIPHSLLSFEITETEAVSSIPAVNENMKRLIDGGYFLLLDDFGSGFANFDYLSTLPFACIKLDKSLLWNACINPSQLLLLTEVSKLINQLGLTCVCEGVETMEQARLVRELGVTMQQGWYYSKALSADELVAYVKACRMQKEGVR